MEQILQYLKQTYDPLAIVVYGSYADGSNNADSDFDALVIAADHREFHDVSFVAGVQLDVFVYPAAYFEGAVPYEDFVRLAGGIAVFDPLGKGAALKQQAQACLDARSVKSGEELAAELAWCEKMRLRSRRGDAEGAFRWHWLLTDSLEIFCDIQKHPYLGPKKALNWMHAEHPQAFNFYQAALSRFDRETLDAWVAYLERAAKQL